MVVEQSERESIREQIHNIIPSICKKELKNHTEFSIEALIGIRFSKDDVLLVTINQTWKNENSEELSHVGNKDSLPVFLADNVNVTNSFLHGTVQQQLPTKLETIAQQYDIKEVTTHMEEDEDEADEISAHVEVKRDKDEGNEITTHIEVKDEDEAQILIPNQGGGQVMMPQKIWELLQQGKCKVRHTAEGQLITAPVSLLLPHFGNLLTQTNSSSKTTIKTEGSDQTKSDERTLVTKNTAGKTKTPGKRGRPLKQPDPALMLAESHTLVADEAGLIRHMEDGSIAVFTEDNLPDTVVVEEVRSTDSTGSASGEKEHRCDICGKVLATARSLQFHIQGLHAPPVHQCIDCGENFPFPLKQQRCRGCSIPGRQPRAMRCLSCGRIFKHRFLLMRHRATCAQSDKVDSETLSKYMTVIEETTIKVAEGADEEGNKVAEIEESGVVECNHCKESFQSEKDLKRHIREQHPGSVQCSGCGERFDNFTLLKHHKKFCQSVIKLGEAKKSKQFICQYCARVYNSSSRLNDHIKGIHLEPSIYCSCGAAFRWRSSLNKHKEKCPYARPEDGKTPRRPARVKVIGEEFVCTYCGISYRSDSGLRSHIQVKHKQTTAFRCTICNTFFATRGALIKHRSRCPPKKASEASKSTKLLYKCSECNITFKKKVFLEKHIIGKHLPGRRYKCNLCGKRFRWNGGLGRHRAKCKKNYLVEALNEEADDVPGMRGVVNHPDVIAGEDTQIVLEVTDQAQHIIQEPQEVILQFEEGDEANFEMIVDKSSLAKEEAATGEEEGKQQQEIVEEVSIEEMKIGEQGQVMVLECSLEEALVAKINEGETELTQEQLEQILHNRRERK